MLHLKKLLLHFRQWLPGHPQNPQSVLNPVLLRPLRSHPPLSQLSRQQLCCLLLVCSSCSSTFFASFWSSSHSIGDSIIVPWRVSARDSSAKITLRYRYKVIWDGGFTHVLHSARATAHWVVQEISHRHRKHVDRIAGQQRVSHRRESSALCVKIRIVPRRIERRSHIWSRSRLPNVIWPNVVGEPVATIVVLVAAVKSLIQVHAWSLWLRFVATSVRGFWNAHRVAFDDKILAAYSLSYFWVGECHKRVALEFLRIRNFNDLAKLREEFSEIAGFDGFVDSTDETLVLLIQLGGISVVWKRQSHYLVVNLVRNLSERSHLIFVLFEANESKSPRRAALSVAFQLRHHKRPVFSFKVGAQVYLCRLRR